MECEIERSGSGAGEGEGVEFKGVVSEDRSPERRGVCNDGIEGTRYEAERSAFVAVLVSPAVHAQFEYARQEFYRETEDGESHHRLSLRSGV